MMVFLSKNNPTNEKGSFKTVRSCCVVVDNGASRRSKSSTIIFRVFRLFNGQSADVSDIILHPSSSLSLSLINLLSATDDASDRRWARTRHAGKNAQRERESGQSRREQENIRCCLETPPIPTHLKKKNLPIALFHRATEAIHIEWHPKHWRHRNDCERSFKYSARVKMRRTTFSWSTIVGAATIDTTCFWSHRGLHLFF